MGYIGRVPVLLAEGKPSVADSFEIRQDEAAGRTAFDGEQACEADSETRELRVFGVGHNWRIRESLR